MKKNKQKNILIIVVVIVVVVFLSYKGDSFYLESTTAICTETDGGRNIFIKGISTLGGTDFADYCKSSSSVFEYVCSGTAVIGGTETCPTSCVNGACETGEEFCIDTDGGFDIYNKGVTTSDINGEYTDRCSSNLPNGITEFYCDSGGQVAGDTQSCPSDFSCSYGECISTPDVCTDSDGGRNYAVRGTVTTTSDFTDYCTDSTYLKEYECSTGGGVNGYDVPCDNGCSAGICISTSAYCGDGSCNNGETCSSCYIDCGDCIGVCIDSDGDDIYTKGTTTVGFTTHTDSCETPTQLYEWTCSGSTTMIETLRTCPTGYLCDEGACEESSIPTECNIPGDVTPCCSVGGIEIVTINNNIIKSLSGMSGIEIVTYNNNVIKGQDLC